MRELAMPTETFTSYHKWLRTVLNGQWILVAIVVGGTIASIATQAPGQTPTAPMTPGKQAPPGSPPATTAPQAPGVGPGAPGQGGVPPAGTIPGMPPGAPPGRPPFMPPFGPPPGFGPPFGPVPGQAPPGFYEPQNPIASLDDVIKI